jgi:hypothetical protein
MKRTLLAAAAAFVLFPGIANATDWWNIYRPNPRQDPLESACQRRSPAQAFAFWEIHGGFPWYEDKGNGEVLVGYTYNGQKDAEFFFDSLKGCEDFVQFWAQQHDKYRLGNDATGISRNKS